MKHLIIAVMIAAVAVVATNARANDVTMDVALAYPSTSFGATHIDNGSFTDTFTFTGISDGINVLASASLITIGLYEINPLTGLLMPNDAYNIDFTSVSLNGNFFATSGVGFVEFAVTPALLALTTPLKLEVMGLSGSSSSYGGTLNVRSVPEPASLMLLGAGLAGIGIWRRKSTKI